MKLFCWLKSTGNNRYGALIETLHGVVFKNKPVENGLSNRGAYLFMPSVFSTIKSNRRFSFEEDFLQSNAKELKLKLYRTTNFFIDIGVPQDYQKAQTALPELKIL